MAPTLESLPAPTALVTPGPSVVTVASESGQATSTVAEVANEFVGALVDATALTSPPEIDAASNTSVSGFEEVPASNTSAGFYLV